MDLIRGRVADGADPALEMAATHALLRAASSGAVESVLRIHRPTPMVAFGRRDANRPGFGEAVRACREAGFTPVVRPAGGRAVACTSQALVVEHVQHAPGVFAGMEERFTDYGALLADALRGVGIAARVGEVPGEYCPGAHSINVRGTQKLIGTAQRMVRDAWLFSSVLILDDTAVLQPLLAQVYAALEMPFDPASVGSTAEEGASPQDVEDAVLAAYDDRFGLVEVPADSALLDAALALVGDHRVA
ncbi:lipoyl protein ligase domain-containing protein [Nocardioides sp. AE5]|uniref:lipoate--protein ligase family protein n=1 Tax=Nocardioides sp. AE5 TaxID=2962573 RepID=UPI0028818EF5|nr:lipoate--protein ligase family protein [Nocardioides sp. AE5]MDT0200627.1 lipoate--protein ligase family protein [Nocardioides sp. AE5]